MTKTEAAQTRMKIRELRDAEVLGLTIYLEAAGEELRGRVAVGQVVLNRLRAGKKHFGSEGGIKGVCLRSKQFSCFNDNDPGLEKVRKNRFKQSSIYQACLGLATSLLVNPGVDPTDGATHYFNPDVCGTPEWSQTMEPKCRIGNHVFFKEV